MTSFFISDLHLSPSHPQLLSLFVSFISGPASHATHLYILGDLFNTWLGDDLDAPWVASIAQLLQQRKQSGKYTYFMPGNRDFLVQSDFCARAGMQLLQDPTIIEIGGRPILLSHGDQYCTADKPYQRYRRWTRCPLLQWSFLHLPVKLRQKIADRLRKKSSQYTRKNPDIMDVSSESIVDALTRYSVECMIHGHVHRAAIHTHEVRGQTASRYVLGDWGTKGSVICAQGQDLQLMQFDPILGVHPRTIPPVAHPLTPTEPIDSTA